MIAKHDDLNNKSWVSQICFEPSFFLGLMGRTSTIFREGGENGSSLLCTFVGEPVIVAENSPLT